MANLDQAGREMKEGAGDLRRDQPRQAQPHGELASEALGRAIAQTEQEMSQLAADMVDQLTKMAEQLGDAQAICVVRQKMRWWTGKSYGRIRKASIRGWKICCKKLTVRQGRLENFRIRPLRTY